MIYAENVLICIAMPLAVTILFLKGSARRFIVCFLCGMIVCLLSAYIGGFFEMISKMTKEDTSVFISPIIEEIMKLLPVLFYLVVLDLKEEELMLSATGIGAGFATFENCCYILTSGAESLSYVLIRGMAVGVMHLVSMVALSIGLELLKRYKAFTFSGVVGALSLAVTFHALYNLLVSEPGPSAYIGYAMPLVCAEVFYSLYRKYKTVEE